MTPSGNSTGAPTPPIAFDIDPAQATNHLDTQVIDVDDALLVRLRSACASVDVEAGERAEASRDWWPSR